MVAACIRGRLPAPAGESSGNVFSVAPPPDRVMERMGDLEKYLRDQPKRLPGLIKAALSHVQFETIHPFLDSNGRLGQLLITLILCAEKALRGPPVRRLPSDSEGAGDPTRPGSRPSPNSVPDMGICSVSAIALIVDTVDQFMESSQPVYLHFWGGHARLARGLEQFNVDML